MDGVVKIATKLLRSGGHGMICCSYQQLNAWRVKLQVAKCEDGQPAFTVTPVPINLLKTPEVKRSRASRRSTTLRSTSEIAVHFVKRGLSMEDQLAKVDYDAGGDVPTRYPSFSNTIDNIPDLEHGEQVRFKGKPLRSEQKSIYVTRHLLKTHPEAGDLMVDLFFGTCTTGAGCITVPKGEHRHFVGCEVDGLAHTLSRRRLIITFANLVLSEDIDMGEANKPSRATLQGIVFAGFRSNRCGWNRLPGYPSSTLLPAETMAFIVRIFNDSRAELMSGNISEEWPMKLRERVLGIDVNNTRAYECMGSTVYISKSESKSPSAGQGLFASRHLKKNTVIGYYYGPIVYENLLRRSNASRLHGARMCSVSKGDFQKCAIGLHIDPVKLGLPPKKEIFLVPSEYNVFKFVNDARYLEDDEEKDTPGTRREPNITFWQPDVVTEISTLKSPHTIKVKALKDIPKNAELLIDYGPEYQFSQLQSTEIPRLAGKKRKNVGQ